ncbi:MAG: GntR family transcriptional regulator [Syntrophorhabdaceae bacterium]|nr:GntR family transcriptional regulator [Syntrophorhabdaceae bacterium]
MRRHKIHIDSHQTLRERIVSTIRSAITNGQLKPGSRIAETEFAERFGISRTPIREAFRQLETEGFITVQPRKGAIVASFSAQDISNFYDLKAILEGYAARLATMTLTEDEIDRMDAINKMMNAALAKKDFRKVVDLHNEFRDIFLHTAGNDRLQQIVRTMTAQFQRYRVILAVPGKMEGSVEQHKEILEAFRKRDPALAEKLVQKNALHGKKTLLKEFSKMIDRSGRDG